MNTISNGFDTSILSPEGIGQVIVEQAGARRLTLTVYENSVVELTLGMPTLRKLVLSGGGAKGVAYSGAVSALEKHDALQGIDVLYGSSVGAIMAAMIACGMSAAQFDTLTDQTSLLSLLDSSDQNIGMLQRAFTAVGEAAQKVLPGKLGNYSQLLFSVLPRLQSQAQPLQALIREQSRAVVLTRIAESGSAQSVTDVIAIKARLESAEAVTFADLSRLNAHIPAIKNLHVTGTAMFEGRPQLLVFNAALTPDMDIAQAVHISASLPVVFKQPGKTDLQFQEFDEITLFQDGGVLLNTPVPQLIDNGQIQDRLSGLDMLIFIFEATKPSTIMGTIGGKLTDWLTGTQASAGRDYQQQRLAAFAEQTVVVPLKTEKGDFSSLFNGTLNFTMTPEVKNHLQEQLFKAVETHLSARHSKRQSHRFASLDEALLSLDVSMLGSLLQASESTELSALAAWRKSAVQALDELDRALTTTNQQGRLELTGEIQLLLANLDRLAQDAPRTEWLARQLNQPGSANFQQMMQAMRGWAVDFPFCIEALAQMHRRDVQVIASNIREAVIFPSLHLLGQTDKNINLLLRCDHLLELAETAEHINQALDLIIGGYASRNPLSSKPWRANTIDLAKAWKIEP